MGSERVHAEFASLAFCVHIVIFIANARGTLANCIDGYE